MSQNGRTFASVSGNGNASVIGTAGTCLVYGYSGAQPNANANINDVAESDFEGTSSGDYLVNVNRNGGAAYYLVYRNLPALTSGSVAASVSSGSTYSAVYLGNGVWQVGKPGQFFNEAGRARMFSDTVVYNSGNTVSLSANVSFFTATAGANGHGQNWKADVMAY